MVAETGKSKSLRPDTSLGLLGRTNASVATLMLHRLLRAQKIAGEPEGPDSRRRNQFSSGKR
jgi:hypothetical protein